MEVLKAILSDALAFVFDPDARKPSNYLFPSGRPMSVREAKLRGYSLKLA